MRKKNKPDANPARPSAAIIAKLAGISTSRVNVLRAEGRSDTQIVVMSVQYAQQQLVLRGLPATPVEINGHGANGSPSYAASLAERERWSAELKKLQVMERRDELVPISYVKLWGLKFLTEAKDVWMRGPSELCDQLAAEDDPVKCALIMRGFCERVVAKLYECERLWSPPPPPEAA
jgi:hypothetical protein